MPTRAVSASPRLARVRRYGAAALGALLLGDASVLMLGYGQYNVGVLVPLVLGIALLVLSLGHHRWQAWLARSSTRRRVWQWVRGALIVWCVTLVGFCVALMRGTGGAATAAEAPPEAIIVLGSRAPQGRPSATLAARLEVAFEQAQRFPEAIVVVSGGVDHGEQRSEAEAMGDYLRERGVPAGRILQEERSTSTAQNLAFSRALLAERGITADAPLRLVSSDFHTLRAGWIAHRAGFRHVVTVGAPTPLSVRYNAWLREYFAVLSGFVLREF